MNKTDKKFCSHRLAILMGKTEKINKIKKQKKKKGYVDSVSEFLKLDFYIR